jgi:hypothetical protein
MGWFWGCILAVAMTVGAVFGIGAAITSAVGRKSDVHRRRGRFVLAWATAGAAVGGSMALLKVDADSARYFHEFGGGFIGMGLIAGVIVGNIHGLLATHHPLDQQ